MFNKLKLSQKLYFGFSIVILLMVILIGYTYINYNTQVKAVDINLHTYEVINNADGILESLLNMETSARGFVLTGDEVFLESYTKGFLSYEQYYHAIKNLTTGNKSQQDRLVQLQERFEAWYDWESNQIVEGRKKVNRGQIELEVVVSALKTNTGKNEMDLIHSILKAIIEEEQQLLNIRNQNLMQTQKATTYAIIIGGILTSGMAILISVFTARSVSNPISQLIKASEEITKKNYQTPIHLKADKELTILINRFNEMQEAILLREEKLEKKNEMLRSQRDKLRDMAFRDGLTGLFNHSLLIELFEKEFEKSRNKHSVSFLMLDIDYFKQVNDTYGHLAGDIILRQVAKILTKSTRADDIIGRYGGEEFGIILPDTDAATALSIGEKIRQTIKNHLFDINTAIIQITLSCGIYSAACEEIITHMEVIKLADEALYRAKQKGRDRVEL